MFCLINMSRIVTFQFRCIIQHNSHLVIREKVGNNTLKIGSNFEHLCFQVHHIVIAAGHLALHCLH